jgi:hypothetical protein
VHDSIDAFSASPVAPSIDWTLPNIDMGSLGTLTLGEHYVVDLAPFSAYMSIVRTLISYVLWFGAVWYVGSRLLGIKGGGDPTDAIDEAYSGFVE